MRPTRTFACKRSIKLLASALLIAAGIILFPGAAYKQAANNKEISNSEQHSPRSNHSSSRRLHQIEPVYYSEQIEMHLKNRTIEEYLRESDKNNYAIVKGLIDVFNAHEETNRISWLVFAIEKNFDRMIWAEIIPALNQDSPIASYVIGRIRQWEDNPDNIKVLDLISSRLVAGPYKDMVDAHSFAQTYKSFGLETAIKTAAAYGNPKSNLQFLQLSANHIAKNYDLRSAEEIDHEIQIILNFSENLGPYRRTIMENIIDHVIKNRNMSDLIKQAREMD